MATSASATASNEQRKPPEGLLGPYGDADVRSVLDGLIDSDEVMSALAALRFPRLSRWLPGVLTMLVRRALRRRLRDVQTVRDFQASQEPLFEYLVAATTSGFTFGGTERLDPNCAYTFISNHRDIALDSALVNYALWLAGRDTVRIGIGDNLLGWWYATDLMRLNKSFVIPRSVRGAKAMYRAFSEVSKFIHDSIRSGESVWLAQRQGRAKAGDDRTDPAIMKMLQMASRGEGEDAGLAALRIVPVAISYELDPCDVRKAVELSATASEGFYEKAPGEDLESIVLGIRGPKGRVHIEFGEPLGAAVNDAEEAAGLVDAHIANSYRLFPTHRWAWEQREGRALPEELGSGPADQGAVELLRARVAEVSPELRSWLLAMYANPVDFSQSGGR